MKIEIRSDKVIIDGYVNVTDRRSRPLLGRDGNIFIEEIKPGAFARALKKNDDIKMLLNHDNNHELGSTKTNVRLQEDVIGLRAIAEITDSKVIDAARNNKLKGWSFGFENPKETTYEENGKNIRSITDLDLLEVSLIDENMTPCYQSTTVETRADNKTVEIRAMENDLCEINVEYNISNYLNEIEKLKGGK